MTWTPALLGGIAVGPLSALSGYAFDETFGKDRAARKVAGPGWSAARTDRCGPQSRLGRASKGRGINLPISSSPVVDYREARAASA
jgi:hypothetical protein